MSPSQNSAYGTETVATLARSLLWGGQPEGLMTSLDFDGTVPLAPQEPSFDIGTALPDPEVLGELLERRESSLFGDQGSGFDFLIEQETGLGLGGSSQAVAVAPAFGADHVVPEDDGFPAVFQSVGPFVQDRCLSVVHSSISPSNSTRFSTRWEKWVLQGARWV